MHSLGALKSLPGAEGARGGGVGPPPPPPPGFWGGGPGFAEGGAAMGKARARTGGAKGKAARALVRAGAAAPGEEPPPAGGVEGAGAGAHPSEARRAARRAHFLGRLQSAQTEALKLRAGVKVRPPPPPPRPSCPPPLPPAVPAAAPAGSCPKVRPPGALRGRDPGVWDGARSNPPGGLSGDRKSLRQCTMSSNRPPTSAHFHF